MVGMAGVSAPRALLGRVLWALPGFLPWTCTPRCAWWGPPWTCLYGGSAIAVRLLLEEGSLGLESGWHHAGLCVWGALPFPCRCGVLSCQADPWQGPQRSAASRKKVDVPEELGCGCWQVAEGDKD